MFMLVAAVRMPVCMRVRMSDSAMRMPVFMDQVCLQEQVFAS